MKLKVLVTGADGVLGSYFLDSLKDFNVIGTSRRKSSSNKILVDFSDDNFIDKIPKVDVIIHCAAITDVDFCEKNKDVATKINIDATRKLAEFAESNGIHLIYISTDSVYSEKNGISSEESDLNPVNHYAFTKLQGEKVVSKISKYTILRLNYLSDKGLFAWIYNSLSKGKHINGFYDVFFSPIFIGDIVVALKEIIVGNVFGKFNLGGLEKLSKLDLILLVSDKFGFDKNLVAPVKIGDINMEARRPFDTVMDSTKIINLLKLELLGIEEMIDKLKNHYNSMMDKLIDSLQLEIDKNKLSSEVHLLLRKKNVKKQ